MAPTTAPRRWAVRTMAAAFALAVLLLPAVQAPPTAHAAALVVNTLTDADPPATDGLCSLREAITNANDNAATFPDCPAGAGTDTITFSVSGTIVLTDYLPTTFDPAGLVVEGSGQLVVISGNNSVGVFSIRRPAILSNLVITKGRSSEGAIHVYEGPLQLKDSVVTQNTLPSGTGQKASGIVVQGGSLEVIRSVLSDNTGQEGGAIYSGGGTVLIAGSTLSNNYAEYGGGVYSMLSTTRILSSTFSSNQAVHAGGAVGGFEGLFFVANSTLSGNKAGVGGAIGAYGGATSALVLRNSTVSENSATSLGGIWYPPSFLVGTSTTYLANTILSRNTGGDCAPNSSAIRVIGESLNVVESCVMTGTLPIVADARLAQLADNGGLTQTHALLPGSYAEDAGDPAVCASAPVGNVDQRGVSRPTGIACDLGAYESPLVAHPGGRNLRVTGDYYDLIWDAGNLQDQYTLLTLDVSTGVASLRELWRTSVAFVEPGSPPGFRCYVLAPTRNQAVVGLSDLECALKGVATGPETSRPIGFALTLNQTASATMTWTPPAGGVGSYLLQRIPLDGTPISSVPLGAGVTTTTQAVTSAGTCFQLIAYRVLEFGTTNVLCGVPGVSTLSAGGRVASIGAVTEAVATLAGRLKAAAVFGGE